MRDTDLYWADLVTKMARDGVLSYTELKAMDVFEFFLLLVNYERQSKNGKSDRLRDKPK